MRSSIAFTISLAMFAVFVYALSGDIKRESRFQGYQMGCSDTMISLYEKLDIKNIDQQALLAFCTDRAREYFKK